MSVFPARDSDVGCLAGRRIAPIGCDQHRSVELAPIAERDDDSVVAALNLGHLRLPHQPQILAPVRAGMKRASQVAVLVHPAEWLAIIGVEMKRARLESVGDRDPPDRATRLGKM